MASSNEDRKYVRIMLMFVRVFLPAFAATYFVLSLVMDFSSTEEIIGVCAVLTFAIDIYLKSAPIGYDGQIVISSPEPGKRVFLLELNKDPDDIQRMGTVLFRVVEEKASSS